MKKIIDYSHYKRLLLVGLIVCMSFFILNSSSAFTWDDGSLVLFYSFDEASGDAWDSGSGLYNGITNGVTYQRPGKINYAYEFDGGTSGDDVSFTPILLSNWTLSGWVYADAYTSVWVMPFGSTTQNKFIGWDGTIGSEEFRVYGASDWQYPYHAPVIGSWQHWVVTSNYTDFHLYINGTNIANKTIINGSMYFDNIGDTYKGLYDFDGKLDLVGIWSRTLTSGEVEELWNGGAGLNYASVSGIFVKLDSPINDSVLSSTSINFTANYSVYSTYYNLQNATYNIWYSNGTIFNSTLVSVTGNTENSTTLQINDFSVGSYYWNVRTCGTNATSTYCISSINNNTFSVGSVLDSIVYKPSTFETATETFSANLSITEGSQISLAQLVYNGTSYSISNIFIDGTSLILTKSITIPLNVHVDANETREFYFKFTYEGGYIQETKRYSQNVSFINLVLCDATYTIQSLNFTLYDEKNLKNINVTSSPSRYESYFKYWLGDGLIYKNYSYQSINSTIKNNFSFCIFPYQPDNYTFKANLDSVFSAEGYSENEYYLRNATLTNKSGDFELFLFLLGSSLSTKFYVTIKQGIVFIEDALVNIAKFFVGEGVYKTVSIKITDDAGSFPFYAELDSKYLWTITKGGNVLGIVEKVASCGTTPCELEINLQKSIDSIFSKTDEYYASNVLSNISYNPATKMVTYTFIDLTGLAQYFRLHVQKLSFNGSIGETICDRSLYTSAGSMTCNLTGHSGDFMAYGYISRSPEKIDKIYSFFISDALSELGLMGILLNIAILITMVFVSAVISRGNPAVVITMLGITILLLKIGQLFPFSWIVVISIEAGIIFILMKVKS